MKKLKMALAVICLSAMFAFSAMANDGALSLEELQQQAQETQVVIENEDIVVDEYADDRSAIVNIAGAAKLDSNSKTVNKIGAVMNVWAAKVMQFIGYIISIGLGLVTAIDVCYMAIPPLQGILANGHKGKASDENNGPLMLGPQAVGGPRGQLGPNNQMNNQQQENRTRFVSQEALDAVEEGKNGAIFKVYLKKRWMTCVMAPVIFVLAATGVLSHFGFMLGEVVSQWIGGISL